MEGYYTEKLAAERLKKCYDLAPPRVQRYLEAEVDFVLKKINPKDLVLDLGCGYGRIVPQLARKAGLVIGIDTSYSSLILGRKRLKDVSNCLLIKMNAACLAFKERSFDVVACIQNGISAFQVNQQDLIRESVRAAKPGGIVLFSTYSEKFWQQRLSWFELQAEAGLLEEIDYTKTGEGIIVCKDGFRATTVSPGQFFELTSGLNVQTRIIEVDESSLFCVMKIPNKKNKKRKIG
jgi:2-polyprenyl-6-hydroxyphenyl methylase/3-demethylubiquinone-9 3-methyltransferase